MTNCVVYDQPWHYIHGRKLAQKAGIIPAPEPNTHLEEQTGSINMAILVELLQYAYQPLYPISPHTEQACT